jgi:hypothetical protein
MTATLIEIFGTLAVSTMVICYAVEGRGPRFVLGFALACLASSIYAALIGSMPFMLIETIWAGLAFRRWQRWQDGQGKRANIIQGES